MIDLAFIDSLGLGGLPEDEKQLMVDDIVESLMERVSDRAEAVLDPQQLAEFDQLITTNPDATHSWLATHLPDYKQMVDEEIQKLRAKIEPEVPAILQQFGLS
jgi:hypothetical protein